MVYLKVEDHILVLHARHEGILSKRVLATSILFVCSLRLGLKRLNILGEETVEIELLALMGRKSRALVVIW